MPKLRVVPFCSEILERGGTLPQKTQHPATIEEPNHNRVEGILRIRELEMAFFLAPLVSTGGEYFFQLMLNSYFTH